MQFCCYPFRALSISVQTHQKSPQTQMCPQEQDHFFNLSVGVSRCVCGVLPSSFLRVGVDLDEDLEHGGGSFQVLQGVRTQTCSGSSCCSDCWNCCTSAIVHLSTDALSMSEDTTCCRMCTNRQNILTIQHFTDCDKKKEEDRDLFTFANVDLNVFGFLH